MRRPAPLALLLLCFFALPLSGQEGDWFVGKEIQDFTFNGLKEVGINEMRPIVEPYIGRPFDYELFWEVQGKLYELDYFDQIDAEATEADETREKVIIEFTVQERPTISRISIVGNRRVSRPGILDKVLIKRGDFVSQSEILLDVENIRTHYIEKGFPDVEITADRILNEEDNTVEVVFRIDEGRELKVSEIRFSGNEFISDNTLKGQMQTKEQGLFRSGAFDESLLQEDVAAIEAFYHNRGYIDAEVLRVQQDVEEAGDEDDRAFIVLTLFVDEGEQWFYGGMTWEGNEVFSDEEIEELLRLSPGGVFNLQRVEAEFQRIVSLYTDSGYIYNVINREETRDEAAKTVSYHVTIQEFEKAHIENIVLQGNEKTKDYVILRELPFEEGDIFSVEKIRQGYLNLYNLQYFSAVDINPVEGSERGLMDLIISMEEQSWASFRFALAFSGGDFPISGQLGWSDTNFMGTGRTLSADLEGSIYRQGISLSFQDDYLFGENFGGGASLSFYHNVVRNVYQDIQGPLFFDEDVPDPYKSEDEYEDALEDGDLEVPFFSTMEYDSWDISLGVNTGYFYRIRYGRLGVNTGLSSTMTYITYDDEIYRPYNSLVRDNLRSWDFVNTWGTTLYWDNRDIFYNPTTGWYLSQYLGLTGGFLLGSRDFVKLTSRAEAYLTLFEVPLGEKFDLMMVLAGHTDISFIVPQIGGAFEFTPRDTLALDGITIARGWSYRSDYKALWNNNLELRMPLARQFLWWTWFFDAAVPWPEISDMQRTDIEDFYFSWGGGLRFTIPGLPIRLYLAQAFRVDDGKVELQSGDIPLGGLDLKFVISIVRPGGF